MRKKDVGSSLPGIKKQERVQLSFDMAAYREKLRSTQSHYAHINIPPGLTET